MPRSTTCATDILEAWYENDGEQLRQKLANGAMPDFEPLANSHERERLELLYGISTQIAHSITFGQGHDAGVYIHLLKHLASSEESAAHFACAGVEGPSN